MNYFSRLLRQILQSIARQINVGSGNYNERIEGDYIQNIYNFFQSRSESQAETKRDKTQQKLLDWISHEVESRLKNSLHNRVSILLEKEEDPNQVIPPWAIDVKIGTHQPFQLPSNKGIITTSSNHFLAISLRTPYFNLRLVIIQVLIL